MALTHFHFEYENAHLHYLKSGNGPKSLFVFHGFGQNHQTFEKLITFLPHDYTVYCFDIFFHGKSVWNNGEIPLTKSFWKSLLLKFLAENRIDRFDLLGFSMGGKFVLGCLEASPEKVDRIILIAADGIQTNFWYGLATYPFVLRKLFKSMILHPKRFNSISKFVHKIGLIDKSVLRFVESQMNTEAKRIQVYYSWVVFRLLRFDLKEVSRNINAHKTEVYCLSGRFDRMIPPHFMNTLTRKLNNYKHDILEAGHTNLIEESLPLIGNYLGKKS